MDDALGDLASAGAGRTVNAFTLILSYSNNVIIFPELLLLPGADEAVWHKSTVRRGSGG